MNISSETRLFFDASVLVAGSHSTIGGSALLLEACKARGFRAQLTSAILLESLRTLREFPLLSQQRFQRSLAEVSWELLPVPPHEVLDVYIRYVDPKDAHVLAAAVEGGAEFLLTLDRRHILAAAESVKKANLPVVILRPGDFIRQYYPLHVDYPHLPQARGQ